MKKYLKIAAISMICVSLFGCSSLVDKGLGKIGYQAIDKANQQIEQVKQDAKNQIDVNNKKIQDEEKSISDAANAKDQSASNYLFNAEFAITTLPEPLNRTDLVIDTNLKSAAAYLPPPTAISIQNALVEVKKELNETITSNADLAKKLQDAQTQAQILSAQQKNAQDTIDALKTSNTQIVNSTSDKVSIIQAQKDAATKSALSKEQQAVDDAKDADKLKEKIMWITGLLSIVCIAGSIWSPVFKTEFIEGATLFGFLTLAIPYVTGLILGITGGVIFIVILIKIGLQHNTAVTTIAASTNMPKSIVAKAVSTNTTALLVNDPVPSTAQAQTISK
jgi:hypothetical protein